MSKLLQELGSGKILLGDGAMGTSLHQIGLAPGECPESWNLSHPQQVQSVIAGYVEAGSDLVETNTFGGTRFKLERFGLADKVSQINRAAAEIARHAAGPDIYVAGSVGPTGVFMEPLGEVSEQAMYDAFAEQVAALARGGADAVCIETMTAREEALAALRAARELTNLPVIVTITFDKNPRGEYRTMMGVSPTQAAEELTAAGADIVGSNCGTGIIDMVAICREMRAVTDRPIMIQANAGLPVLEDGRTIFKETPAQMAQYVPQLLAAGANIIGGCCGTTPAHIAAIKEALLA